MGIVGQTPSFFWEPAPSMGAGGSPLPEEQKEERQWGPQVQGFLGLASYLNLSLLVLRPVLEPRLAGSSALMQSQAAAWTGPRKEVMCGETPASRKGTSLPWDCPPGPQLGETMSI